MATKKTPPVIPASKPRNFVAKNAPKGGAGAHKDKKKAAKQGDVRHKKPFSEGMDLEGDTVKNSLHTIIRVATHLERAVDTNEDFPEWVSEKIGATKELMVSVMDFMISSHEQQDGDRLDHGPTHSMSEAFPAGLTPPGPMQSTPVGTKLSGMQKPGQGSIEGQVAALNTQFQNLQKNTDQQKKTFEMMINGLSQRLSKVEASSAQAGKPVTTTLSNKTTAESKYTALELAVMEGGHSLAPAPLRKRKVKENYNSYLKSVLNELKKN